MISSTFFSTLYHSPFWELLTGRAHRPRPADATVSLKDRFANEPLLLVMVAKERAATLRVTFDCKGCAHIGDSRQMAARHPGELAGALQVEAQAAGASWALIVLAFGWQAELGLRSARSPQESRRMERYLLPAERPELFVPHPRSDLAYAVVDHPLLDRSVVFGCKRKDLNTVLQEVRTAGLGVAGVRLGVASQVELWLANAGDKALERDLLVSDGMGVLLLNTKEGDFAPPVHVPGGVAETLPRQASARPNDVAQDCARFIRDNGMRPLIGLWPSDPGLSQAISGSAPEIDILRPEAPQLHDSALASLEDGVRHELNPNLREERPAISAKWRVWVLGYFSALLAMLCVCSCFALQAFTAEQASTASIAQRLKAQQRVEVALAAMEELSKEKIRARELRDWVSSGYHAQAFLHRILRELPEGVSLDRIAAQLEGAGPQLSLEFTLLGGDEAQIAATRAVEKTVLGLDCQIGERHAPVPVASSGLSHRWRLILPTETGKRKQ